MSERPEKPTQEQVENALELVRPPKEDERPAFPVAHNPYQGIGTLELTEEQKGELARPATPDLISFRPDGLAYVPQVHFRAVLSAAFGPGGWGICPVTGYKTEGGRVYYHGGLYVGGKFVAEAIGSAEYFPDNPSQNLSDAWESAKSDCLTRLCKDLNVFKELWDPKFVDPLKKEWAAKVRPHCPGCGQPEYVRPSKDGGWFCWKNPAKGMNGCGWKGEEPARGKPEGRQEAQKGPSEPLTTPTPTQDTHKAPTAPLKGSPAIVPLKSKEDPPKRGWIPPFEWLEHLDDLMGRLKPEERQKASDWLYDPSHRNPPDWFRMTAKLRNKLAGETLPPLPECVASGGIEALNDDEVKP